MYPKKDTTKPAQIDLKYSSYELARRVVEHPDCSPRIARPADVVMEAIRIHFNHPERIQIHNFTCSNESKIQDIQ